MSEPLPSIANTSAWDNLELSKKWFNGTDSSSDKEASPALKSAYGDLVDSLLHEYYYSTNTPLDHRPPGNEGGYGSVNTSPNPDEYHGALDIKARESEDVYSVEGGEIVNINRGIYNGNVNYDYAKIMVKSADDKIWIYGHVKASSSLGVGDTINTNTKIGTIFDDGQLGNEKWQGSQGSGDPISHIHLGIVSNELGDMIINHNARWGHFVDANYMYAQTTHPLQGFLSTNNGSSGQTINGTSNADTLTGGAGDDIIKGLAGYDVLQGVGGNDSLYGGYGNDKLTGGLGVDSLQGDDGADTFIFTNKNDSKTSSYDTIVDFTHGVDKIDVSAIDANETVSGIQSFTYVGSGNSNTAGQLDYDSGGGWVRASTDNVSGWDVYIKVGSGLGLDASDFVV